MWGVNVFRACAVSSSRQDSRIGNGWLMRTCFTTVASSLWVQRLIVTVHRVRHLTMGPCLHNAGIDAGVGDCRRRSRNVLLSLILHSPGLLIQRKPLNHDRVPSAEAAKFPCLKRSQGFCFFTYKCVGAWIYINKGIISSWSVQTYELICIN